MEGVVLGLCGQGFKSSRIMLSAVPLHAGELIKGYDFGQTIHRRRWVALEIRSACLLVGAVPVTVAGFQLRIDLTAPSEFMPFSPEVQQLIQQVEQLSARPVHVAEETGMKMRATVTPARGGAPAHMVRFKQDSPSPGYLLASRLMFSGPDVYEPGG